MKSESRRGREGGLITLRLGLLEQGRNPLQVEVAPDAMNLEEWCRVLTPIRVEGSADRFAETITIRGVARATVEEVCGRCSRAFERPLETEFMVFSDRLGTDSPADSEELERDGDLVYHDGVLLDFSDAVREAIVLSMPISPLCREDCKGLCPHCGIDLNQESCRCAEEVKDPRWEALKKLKDL
jgi:uncharacterized protein